jgi:hypothetical protein
VGQHTNDVALLRDMHEEPVGQQKFEGNFVPGQLFRLAFPGQLPSRMKSVESCECILPPMAYALVPWEAARRNSDAITTGDFPYPAEGLRAQTGQSRIVSRGSLEDISQEARVSKQIVASLFYCSKR